jgi:hypothetical protein
MCGRKLLIILALLAVSGIEAFAPELRRATSIAADRRSTARIPAPLFSSREDETVDQAAKSKKKTGLDANVKSKLLAESIAPWRTVRLFLYGSLGSGATVGGLITLTGVAAALSGARPDLDLSTEAMNLAIDFGFAALFAFLFKWDLGKQAELSEKVEKKVELKKEQRKLKQGMREREQKLADLMMEITVGADGKKQQAPVAAIQGGAKQHMIIVAGPKKACKDALVGANLLKMDFAMSNVLVVPYETDANPAELKARPSGGFGDRPSYETQPYVASVIGDGWDEYIEAEMKDAVTQNGESARKEGIAIVIANNGKVIRRGVGTVPWRQMVEQLEEAVDPAKQPS